MSAPWRSMTTEERLRWFADHWRRTVPFLFTLAALFLTTVPLFPALPMMPLFGVLAIYVWALFQPSLMPAWLTLPLGVAADLVTAMPIGINATMFPLFTALVRGIEQRFGRRPYVLDWMLVLPLLILYQLGAMQLARFAGLTVDAGPLILQAATTALAYPAFAWACARVQREWVED